MPVYLSVEVVENLLAEADASGAGRGGFSGKFFQRIFVRTTTRE